MVILDVVIVTIEVSTIEVVTISIPIIAILTTHDLEPPSSVRGTLQAFRNRAHRKYVGQYGTVENTNRAYPTVGDQYSGSSISTQPIASITTTWVPQRT